MDEGEIQSSGPREKPDTGTPSVVSVFNATGSHKSVNGRYSRGTAEYSQDQAEAKPDETQGEPDPISVKMGITA